MANIKNFGISGVASDVQFGKTGGRVVYDSGNSVFKITSDGSTLGTLRVATPTNAADAATKQYVDDRIGATGGDVEAEADARALADAALQSELDATQAAAGLTAEGGLVAPTGTDYLGSITTLKGGLVALDSALSSEVSRAEAAELGLSNDISDEADARLSADNALSGALDDEIAARGQGDIDTLASANTYTDGEIDSLDTTLRSYIDSSVSAKDNTDELTEGTTNLFFTDARARAAISVTDAGGDGSLSYNSSTGVITYTGPSAAEVRAHLSAGTGVSYSNGQFSIGQDVGTTANVTFGSVTTTGNVTVGGALSVAGNSTFTANITGNTMSLTGNLTVAGDTVLSEKVTIKSDLNGVVGAGASTTPVFEITDSDGSDKLFQVMQNGDTIIGGVLTVNGTGTSTFAGDVSINGNITVAGDATFLANVSGNAMTMTGDLEVVGNTVLSQLVTVESDVTKALGSDATNVFQVVSSDAQKLFEVRQNGDAIIGGTLTVNGSSAALTGNLTTSGDATVSGDLSVGGTLTVAGDATFQANISGTSMTLSGDLIVGDADTDRVVFNADVDSDFIPNTTGTFDLGTASKEWNNVYANMVYADLTGNVSGNISGQVTDISNHASYIKGLLSAQQLVRSHTLVHQQQKYALTSQAVLACQSLTA
jgi:cytoskeletal protein CcmA (bactofilin family)